MNGFLQNGMMEKIESSSMKPTFFTLPRIGKIMQRETTSRSGVILKTLNNRAYERT